MPHKPHVVSKKLLLLSLACIGCFTASAATYQYNLFVKGFQGTTQATTPSTSADGNGSISPHAVLQSASSLDFGVIPVGISVPSNSFTVTNTGDAVLTDFGVTGISAPFSMVANDCTPALAAGATCTVVMSLDTSAVGELKQSLSLTTSNAGIKTLTLQGNVVDGSLKSSLSSASFGATMVGVSSLSQVATLTNYSAGAINFSNVSLTQGDTEFSQTNDCGTELASGASCNVTLNFKPSQIGLRSGTLSIKSVAKPALNIALSGYGVPPKLAFAPESGSFEPVPLGTTSIPKTFTLSNPSADTVTISGLSVTGGASDFGQSNNCDKALPAGGSCEIAIEFTPTVLGARTGLITVLSSLGSSSLRVAGPGVAPELTFSDDSGFSKIASSVSYPLRFVDTPLHQTSLVRTLQITNTGVSAVQIKALSVISGVTDYGQSNNCGGVLAKGESCKVDILFTPTDVDVRYGSIVLQTQGVRYAVALSGKGVASVGAWAAETSSSFGVVAPGGTAQRKFTYTNKSNTTTPISTTLIGADLSFVENNCGTAAMPTTLLGNGSCSVTLRYAPKALGSLTGASLRVSGTMMLNPVLMGLSGTAATYSVAFDTAPSSDYGLLKAGTSTDRWFTLRNISAIGVTIDGAPSISGNGFSITASSCSSGLLLSANATCQIRVTAKPSLVTDVGTYALSGELLIQARNGAATVLPLTATYNQEAYGLEWVSSGDYGQLSPGVAKTLTFTLKNTSQSVQYLGVAVSLTGSRLTLSSNNCYSGRLLAVGQSCTVNVTASPQTGLAAGDYLITGDLIASNTQGSVIDLALSAPFTQAPYYLDLVDPANGEFGTLAVGASKSKSITLTNSSMSSQFIKTVTLTQTEGSQFSIYASNCTAVTLAPKGTCLITAYAKAPQGTAAGYHPQSALVEANSQQGGIAQLTLSSDYTQPDYSLAWTGSADFGTGKPGVNYTKYVYLVNSSNYAQKIASAPTIDNSDFRISYSNCTVNSSLAAKASCQIGLSFTVPKELDPGDYSASATLNIASTQGDAPPLPISIQYSQEPYAMAFEGIGDFGTVKAGVALAKRFTLRNISTGTIERLAVAPYVTEGIFTLSYSSCVANHSLVANETCVVDVRVTIPTGTPPDSYAFTGTLVSTNTHGVTAEVPLSVQYTQEPYTMTLTGNNSLGDVKLNSTVRSRFTLKNTSLSVETLAAAPAVTGPGFSITNYTCTKGISLTANNTCAFDVVAKGLGSGAQNGTVLISNVQGGSVSVDVSANSP